MEAGSSVPRRQLGRLLKQARERAGITLLAASEELEFSRARMYRVEGGEVGLRKHEVLAMCGFYGTDGELTDVLVRLARESKARGWWQSYGGVVPAWAELYVSFEAAACRLRHWQASLIPGLLQLPEYAEGIFRTESRLDEAAVQRSVAVRMERQRILARQRPPAPQLDVVVDEAALRRPIADKAAMQRQLAHLVNVSQRPGVDVRVLSLASGPHPAQGVGSFVILDFPAVGQATQEPTTIYSENLTGALYLDKPAEVEIYDGVWGTLLERTLDRRGSDDLMAKIIEELDD